MNAIRSLFQHEASVGISTDTYSASLTWCSSGWEVWITAHVPNSGRAWEIVRRFGHAWGAS